MWELVVCLLVLLFLFIGCGIGLLMGLWFCLKSPYAKHALHEAIKESMEEEGLEMAPVKRVRMPWEGDESTFNVVRRNCDDGQG